MPTLKACFSLLLSLLTRENLKLYVTKSITIALIISFCVILILLVIIMVFKKIFILFKFGN